uniref:DUF3095 family protein n=1 Tax=Stappia sp. TaxID=1870903 RepID=UPI003BA8D522
MAVSISSADDFYERLAALSDFGRVGDDTAFSPIPDDWCLLAADIVRSRDALAEGRYKTVNMIAAAVVTAVLNACGRQELPFVFGGDGAMAAVPTTCQGVASRSLAGVRVMARKVCGLELRIAAIPVSALRARGVDLRVAKFELSPGNNLAMFSGGGVEMADAILKDPDGAGPYGIDAGDAGVADLDGLSCRWEELPAEHGSMVTLLLRPAANTPGAVSGILAGLSGALGIDLASRTPDIAPARRSNLRFRFPPTGLWREARIVGHERGRGVVLLRAFWESLAFVLAKASGMRLGSFSADGYLDDVVLNTDYRKFDDTLRLVLDLSAEQVEALRFHLDAEQGAGRLDYGMNVSRSALMTCLVFNLERAGHIHFVDGSDGGFARAALDLKARLESVREGGESRPSDG